MSGRIARHRVYLLAAAGLCGLLLSGCGDRMPQPSTQQLAEFQVADDAGPTIDMERLLMARIPAGVYRTVAGDVLQLDIPKIIDPETPNSATPGTRDTCTCRIGDDGAIILPVVGPFAAAGKSLAEIERDVLAAYHPRYVKAPFPIHVSVLEYHTRTVSVAGAVAQPGLYALRHDQMSLVSLLMKAGGIVPKGATVIRIARANGSVPSALPVSGLSRSGPRQARGFASPMQMQPAIALGPAPDRSGRRMVFEREGPLGTTGWLMFVDRGDTRVRQWLDLESELQRRGFLREVAAATGQTSTATMDERLIRLANALPPLPPGQADAAVQSPDWDTDSRGRLVTSLDAPGADRPVRSAELVIPTRITDPPNRPAVAALALPVKGLNIPFADVALEEGDSIVVEPAHEQFVSVLGLVRNAGNFPYPPDSHYNLAQAIGFAGGLDMVADPRFVSLYRLKPDGQVMSITVQLVDPRKKQVLTEALAMPVKPGDIVSVEQTPRTRTNIFFDRVFRVNLGLYFNPDSVWNNE